MRHMVISMTVQSLREGQSQPGMTIRELLAASGAELGPEDVCLTALAGSDLDQAVNSDGENGVKVVVLKGGLRLLQSDT